jgi:hypothetical protein
MLPTSRPDLCRYSDEQILAILRALPGEVAALAAGFGMSASYASTLRGSGVKRALALRRKHGLPGAPVRRTRGYSIWR